MDEIPVEMVARALAPFRRMRESGPTRNKGPSKFDPIVQALQSRFGPVDGDLWDSDDESRNFNDTTEPNLTDGDTSAKAVATNVSENMYEAHTHVQNGAARASPYTSGKDDILDAPKTWKEPPLWPHQKAAVGRMLLSLDKLSASLLAFDMGLGKSYILIG